MSHGKTLDLEKLNKVIPPPRAEIVKKINAKTPVGAKAQYQKKLHCIHCGKKRLMRLATTILNTDGTVALIFLRLKKFLKTAKETTLDLPNDLIGNCSVCSENTYYKLNHNRKLEVDC